MDTTLNPTQQLFLQCLKAYLSSAPLDMESVCTSAEDFYKLIPLACQHHLWPACFQLMSRLPAWQNLDENYRSQQELLAYKQVANQLMIIENTAFLGEMFEQADIPYIIMKGSSCRRYFPDTRARISSDEDILIRPEDYLRADQLLKELGFETDEMFDLNELDSEKDIPYRSEGGQSLIELHVNAIGNYDNRTRHINRFLKDAFSHREQFELEGHMLWGFDPTYQLMQLLGHFTKHLYENGVGIRQVLDIILCVRADGSRMDWTIINNFLEEIELKKLFCVLMKIGRIWFGITVPLPEECAEMMEDGIDKSEAELLLKDILEGGTYGAERVGQIGDSAYYISALIEDEKAHWLWTIAFPDKKRLAMRYPIIRKYPLLTPFFYIIRWFALALEFLTGKRKLHRMKGNISEGKKRAELLRRFH